ncbi:hypothetical protein M0805_006320 [Coniferiporia weirii]|nr:hypothetical protein M0805_006320 [Coniferiporia weirii]
MIKSRLLSGASGRVLERSSTACRSSRGQHLHADLKLSALYHSAGPLNLRCRGGVRTSNPHRVASTFLSISLYARTLSTDTSQSPSSTKADESPLPASNVGGKPKSKVDLRPGPVKPSTNTASSKPTSKSSPQPQSLQPETSSTSKPHPTKPPPLSATSPKDDVLTETESAGVIEIAKKDVDDAARHGILKPPPPDANFVMRLFHQGKELFKFYWAGLKFVFANRKEVKRIRARVEGGGASLNWREHKFIVTNESDMVKLVPFVLTFLVIEEIIPLIVMYVPGMLPSTCVLPSQRARISAKRHERQREAYVDAKNSGHFSNTNVEDVRLKSFDEGEVKLLCSTVGISSFGFFGMQRRRLAKYLRSITTEDSLLLLEGKGARLKQDEITGVLWDRGFLADSYTPSEQRDRLRWWLDNVKTDANAASKSPEDTRAELLMLMHHESR